MGMFDSLLGLAPPQLQVGTLSALAANPLSMPSLIGGGYNSPAQSASPSAPPGPVSTDDSNSGPSTWQRIAGIVGDALLTGTGHQAIYGPSAQAYAKMQMDPVDAAYKRALTAQALRPPQQAPTEFQKDYGWLSSFDPTSAANFLQNKVNPLQALTGHDENGNPTTTLYRPGSLTPPVSSAGPSADAITYLKQNPSMAPQFEQKYGAGSSAQYLAGGGASTAASPFPIR